jgi:hypothetical protein
VKVFELGSLLLTGFGVPSSGTLSNGIPDGEWAGFAIGPDSLVDLVRIDGQMLAPGRVLPAISRKPTVEPVRGPRTGTGFNTTQANGRCQLIAYECGDPLIPPGPRPPYVHPGIRRFYSATDINPRELFLTLPFSGRKMAEFCIQLNSSLSTPGALTYTAYVLGLRYLPRASALFDPSQEPHQTLVATVNCTAPGFDAFNGIGYSTTFYVGGVDSAEGYDELQLFMETSVGSASPVISANAEAWDVEGGP